MIHDGSRPFDEPARVDSLLRPPAARGDLAQHSRQNWEDLLGWLSIETRYAPA